ncbi:MAG: hypothetical protein FD147_301 [Chloroflexi bacterium]|nr:MAG: hypothetical protein FD147_301 [Chloroflexota bacterium]
MAALQEIKNRIRQALEDSAASRFSDGILESAIRQSLERINERLPRVLTSEVVVETFGRDQPLP